MHDLSQAIAALKSDTIASRETLLIDQALASARADQVPVADASSVITYINLQLAHNDVSQTTRDALIRLHDELLGRASKA
ncbi:hypothetical protein N5D27_13290 [Stutzerimonas stutzeri]|uniref:hypothetical protein n=1 Tax=Stutzerimonas stutzeri TaxID=316 RepID=UPI000F79DF69|nr:hypothetical protein [Stutzerimonas stutzeri]MDH0727468.1 hypothetical protein [Stutzerimonas stutzeri]RRV72102.1 hypothetical protein EGJ18_17410 [Stutzerimonas stutzeri]